MRRVMRWLRGGSAGGAAAPARPRVEEVLYIHLARDGAIFVARGDTGERFWTDRHGLRRELEYMRVHRGRLLYSRDAPEEEPSPELVSTFEYILEWELPIALVEEPHPEALVPPDERPPRSADLG